MSRDTVAAQKASGEGGRFGELNRPGNSGVTLDGPDVAGFVASFRSPHEALMAVARQAGFAVHYQDRECFEASIDRELTDEEWAKIELHLDSYDEWLENSGAAESISFWRWKVLRELDISECAHDDVDEFGRCEDCDEMVRG